MNGESLPTSALPPAYGPMGFGQILDRTFKLVRAHWKLYARVAVLPALALVAIIVLVAGGALLALGPQLRGVQTPPNLETIVLLGFSAIALEIGMVLLSALYLPAAHYAAIQTNRGQMTTAAQAYDVARQRYGRFLWLLVLITLYLVVPLLAIVLAFTLAGVGIHFLLGGHAATLGVLVPAIFGLIYLGFLVYTVFIALRFSLSYAACVDEEITASAALKRSAQLTEGARGRIFVVLLVIYAILYAVTYVALILSVLAVGGVGVLAALIMHVEQGTPAFFALIALGGLLYVGMIAVVSIANYIGMVAAIAVLYDDQKLRLRGEVSPA
jgi:hypothetical protein